MQSGSIILIGLRASGKSTAAAIVASNLGCPALDLDEIVAQREGVANAAALIHRSGIEAFRIAEAAALEALLAQPTPCVLALGGGTPTAPGAAALLRTAAADGTRVIYLRATPQTLRARLALTNLAARPSLTGAGTLDEVDTLFAARDGLYRELATSIVEVDGLSAAQAAAAIVRA